MKKIITLTFVVLALSPFKISAQNTFPNSDSVINYLKGGWTWFKSCGGIAGICNYPQTVGYTKSIRFSRINGFNDSIAYSVYKNGNLVNSSATKVLHSVQGSWYLRVISEGPYLPMGVTLLKCQTDSVWLNDMISDGFRHTYYKDQTVGLFKNWITSTPVKLFPVPTSDFITIQDPNGTVFEKMSFYNLTGAEINLPSVGDAKFDVSELPKGVYFIRINNGIEQYWSKFLKE